MRLAPVSKVPSVAPSAVIGPERAGHAAAVSRLAARLAAAEVDRLGGATALDGRKVAVDELSV